MKQVTPPLAAAAVSRSASSGTRGCAMSLPWPRCKWTSRAPGKTVRPRTEISVAAASCPPGATMAAIRPLRTAISQAVRPCPGRIAAPPRSTRSKFVMQRKPLCGGFQPAENIQRFISRQHVSIFPGHVEQIDRMRRRTAVIDRVVRNERPKIVRKTVDDSAAHAAAGGAAGHHDAVGPGIDEIARERRAEERARMFLG